jgi:hypothetical protein
METTMTTEITPTQTARMRALHDELRKDFNQGYVVVMMMMGVAALGAEAVARVASKARHLPARRHLRTFLLEFIPLLIIVTEGARTDISPVP